MLKRKKMTKWLTKCKRWLENVRPWLNSWRIQTTWLLKPITTSRDARLIAKPIRVNKIAPDYLESISRSESCWAATILDIDTFLSGLGLERPKDLCSYESQSRHSQKPISMFITCTAFQCHTQGEPKSIPRQIKAITGIMERFPMKRGVILPHTHAIRKEIVVWLEARGFGDRIITHDSKRSYREIALKKFFESKRDDLVSPYQPMLEKGLISKEDWPNGWLFLKCRSHLRVHLKSLKEWNKTSTNGDESTKVLRTACMSHLTSILEVFAHHSLVSSLVKSGSISKSLSAWFKVRDDQSDSDDVGHLFILDGSFERYYRQNAHLFHAGSRAPRAKPRHGWKGTWNRWVS